MKTSHSGRAWLVKSGIALALAVITIILTQEFFFTLGPLKELEQNHIDERFRERGPRDIKDSADVIILEITQNTYDGIPADWPWPRSVYAKVLDNLNKAGVRAIGIDLVMSTPDQQSPANDTLVMDIIRKYKNIIVGGKVPRTEGTNYLITRQHENYSSVYFEADSSIGIVEVQSDQDGVIRRYLPFMYAPSTDKFVPSFAYAVLNKYYNKSSLHIAKNTPDYFLFDQHKIPKFDRVSMLVNYYGPSRTFKHHDFIDVLDDAEFKTKDEIELETDINTWDDPDAGLLYSGEFKDKIVLIGSTMPEDKDILPISFSLGTQKGDNLINGVEIHANAIQNIIWDDFLIKEPLWMELLIVVLLTFLSFFLSSFLKEIKTKIGLLIEFANMLLIAGFILAIRELSFYLFEAHSFLMIIISANIAIVLGYVGATGYHFITERRQKGMIKGMFSQYVNSTIVDELIMDPDKLQLGGQRMNLTVFFSDIAGFSTFSENKEPEDLVSFLNEYLSAMTKCVFDSKGTLDKYIGDAVMAFWGAPIPLPDHPHWACRSALEMQKVVAELNIKWQAEGQPHITSRMGINTGDMVVGNVGGKQRFDYTVMGDNVNLGSRLEGANKEYGTLIMISETTYEAVYNDFLTRELDYLVVKGKTKPIKVYELIGYKTDTFPAAKLDSIDKYTQGLHLYRQQEFHKAIELFNQAIEIFPDEYTSKVYIKRCKHYIEEPPGPDWDGVFIMKTK